MFTGNFKSTIGNRNMIANKSIDNPAAYDAWGQYADLKIGRHTFGYEAYWDGFLTGKARAKAIAAEERAKKARNANKAKANTTTTAKSKANTTATAKSKTNAKSKTYIIKRGDNISSIAKKLKVK
jgi:nucleoid-associated protein YgaU